MLLSFGSLFSQNVEWSELLKVSGRLTRILPIDGKTFYTTRLTGLLLTTTNLSNHENFIIKDQEKIVTTFEGNIASIKEVFLINFKTVVFLTDKQDGKYKLSMQLYGKDCLPEGELLQLAEFIQPKGLERSGFFNLIQSQNQQFFCVEYSIPRSKSDNERFGFKVINANLEIVSEGEFDSQYIASQRDVVKRYLSNTGDYFIASKITDKELIEGHSILDKSVLMYLTSKGIKEVNLGDKYISDVIFSSDNNQLITFTGLYGDSTIRLKGVFYFQLDIETQEIINKGFNEFEKDFITEGLSGRDKMLSDKREANSKSESSMYNYIMRDNIRLADGSFVGIIEQYYFEVSKKSNPELQNTYYHYNDLILYKVNESGEFVWLKKIKKKQSSIDGGYLSSTAQYLVDDKMVMLFNDNLKNYDESGQVLKDAENGKNLYIFGSQKKNNCVARVEVDLATGDVQRSMFFGRNETEAVAIPKLFNVDYVNKEMLMVFRFGKKEKFGLINFGK